MFLSISVYLFLSSSLYFSLDRSLYILLIFLLIVLFDFVYLAVVGLASTDLSREYFGRRFNHQPVAIFDIPEPPDTGKALVEFFKDMKELSLRGLYIHDSVRGAWLHKPFLKGHLADAVARYVGKHPIPYFFVIF